MKTIKSTLLSLTPDKQALLMYAFDNNLSQYVEFEANKFIGVNIKKNNFPNFKIEEQAGDWSKGAIKS